MPAARAGQLLNKRFTGYLNWWRRRVRLHVPEALAGIVARLRSANPRVTVLLAQLIPTSRAALRPGIERLNAEIPGLAARLDSAPSRVLAVDHASGFDAARDTRDGIHPNAAGEEKMAAVWHGALQRLEAR